MSRKLQFRDTFSCARLIKDLGVKEELGKIASKLDDKSDVNEVGIEIILTVVEKAIEENNENKVYKFLSGPLEIEEKEIGTMDLFEVIEKLKEVADIEKWKDFLTNASRLIK